jgi:uncharacterized protein (DUF1778 family)
VRQNKRLEARVSSVQKDLAQRAADLQGRTLSEFVAASVREAAERAIREHEVITLTARESRAFVEALLAPPAPNPHLRALAARYRRTTGAQE